MCLDVYLSNKDLKIQLLFYQAVKKSKSKNASQWVSLSYSEHINIQIYIHEQRVFNIQYFKS